MKEPELSQLAVLADALVADPKGYKELLDEARLDSTMSHRELQHAIDYLENSFDKYFSTSPSNRPLPKTYADLQCVVNDLYAKRRIVARHAANMLSAVLDDWDTKGYYQVAEDY
ncbi:MAG: hypothetical protein Q8R47_02550 [Nanoarchaeota archaeon]|nr:hypothetical protein [Nanoarchaeota archaeon]